MTSPTSVFDGPPLDPSSPEARQWVLDELAKGRYTTEPSAWQRFVEWLQHLLSGQPGAGLIPAWGAALVVVVVLAVVALVVTRLLRAEPSTRGDRARKTVVDDEGLSAADYRARAGEARARAVAAADLDTTLRALRPTLGQLVGP